MHRPTRIATLVGVAVTLTAAAPAAAAAASTSAPRSSDQVCLSGFLDLGPFGPYGPYGASGPYGPNGPLHDRPNPIGDAAQCGGLITFILRGGTLDSFIQANIDSVKPR